MSVKEDIDKRNEAVKKAKAEMESPSIQKRVENIEKMLGIRK